MTLATIHNHALALAAAGGGRSAEAVTRLREVWNTRREANGATHRDTLSTVCDLAKTLAVGGDAAQKAGLAATG